MDSLEDSDATLYSWAGGHLFNYSFKLGQMISKSQLGLSRWSSAPGHTNADRRTSQVAITYTDDSGHNLVFGNSVVGAVSGDQWHSSGDWLSFRAGPDGDTVCMTSAMR